MGHEGCNRDPEAEDNGDDDEEEEREEAAENLVT